MIKLRDLSGLRAAWNKRSIQQAVELSKGQRYVEAAEKLDGVEVSADEALSNGKVFAYTYYRRALVHQRDGKRLEAINDLDKALRYGGLPAMDRLLFQNRLTGVGKAGKSEGARRFDRHVSSR